MNDSLPTTLARLRAGAIFHDEIDAAINGVLANPDAGAFRLGAYTLDLKAAVDAHQPAAAALADPDRTEKFKRKLVRTAILMARPAKA